MTKIFTFALILVLTTWVAAEKTHHQPTPIRLVTSFDFGAYPACGAPEGESCIQGIRFYDAQSRRLLVEVPVGGTMAGRRQVSGIATVNSIPRAVYAVTLYRDANGTLVEGGPGDVSALR